MSVRAEAFHAAALELLGTPFRLGGHDRVSGVDCLGLVLCALRASGTRIGPVPHYSLRQRQTGPFEQLASEVGFRPVQALREPGDVLQLMPSASLIHLAVASNLGQIIHAHASLRRTVIGPFPANWQLARIWRLD